MARDQWQGESGTTGVRPVRPIRAPRSEPRLDLQEVLSVLWFRKWSILAITLLTVAVALLVSSRQTPIYESQASVFVTPIDTGAESVPPEDPNLATEAELVSSVAVAQIVAENLGIEDDPRDLLANLEVDQPTDTEILEVSYRDPVPVQARRLAMGFAEGYLQFREAAASKLILERAEDLEAQIGALEQRLKTVQEDLARLPDDDPREASLQTEAANSAEPHPSDADHQTRSPPRSVGWRDHPAGIRSHVSRQSRSRREWGVRARCRARTRDRPSAPS